MHFSIPLHQTELVVRSLRNAVWYAQLGWVSHKNRRPPAGAGRRFALRLHAAPD
jgi:hypothetical protein